ncbi:MAG: hypothetical protein H7039_13660 [Bryobacteraceae bacterium]|nr:hypothetical protein [Bryobacteraceae bacterium]
MVKPRPNNICANASGAIDIDWKVLRAEEVVATGSSRSSRGGFYSDTVARDIGHFSAQAGQHYSVILAIGRDGGDLTATNPKLLVQTYPGAWKDALVGRSLSSMVCRIGATVCFMAGLLTLTLAPLTGWLFH